MLLNADIIYGNLPADMHARIEGVKSSELKLKRPKFYDDEEHCLENNGLYVFQGNRAQADISVGSGCVLVSIGDSAELEPYKRECCVITLDPNVRLEHVLNSLQRTFDLYDRWEHELDSTIENTADIASMLNCSEIIFSNPLYVVDSTFRLLAVSDIALSLVHSFNEGEPLDTNALDAFMQRHELSTSNREPILVSYGDEETLSCNLHDEDEYLGALTLRYTQQAHREGDEQLMLFLGCKVIRAMRQLVVRSEQGFGSLRQALSNLVDGRHIDVVGRDLIDAANTGSHFVCLCLKLSGKLDQMPLGYVGKHIERAFSHCVVFEHNRDSVVAVVSLKHLGFDNYKEAIRQAVKPLVNMGVSVGVSNPHDNLLDVRDLFLQANSVLDAAVFFNLSEGVYCFDDYLLYKMLLDAIGDNRLELLYPEGLKRLYEHDRTSSASYVETLRAYLDNNMSVSRTASELFVHRSTLLERLNRMRLIMGMDLKDADQRLLLMMLLRVTRARDEFKDKQE